MTDIAERSEVSKPSDRERRRFSRKKSLLPARLVMSGGFFESRILDFSRGGAKVECARPIKQGEAVSVTVDPIGIYSGVVAWRADGCFGVQFLAHSKTTTDACDANPAVVSRSLKISAATAGSIVGGDPATTGERRARAPTRAADGERVFTLGAGEVLFRDGDPGGRMYLVQSGTLCVRGARSAFIEEVGAGGILGEMGVVDGRLPRQATAVALTDCDLMEIDTRQFMALIKQTPGFALTVMLAFLRRLPRMRMDLLPAKPG